MKKLFSKSGSCMVSRNVYQMYFNIINLVNFTGFLRKTLLCILYIKKKISVCVIFETSIVSFFFFFLSRLVIIILYCIAVVYTMSIICVRVYTHNIWNVYGGRKGLSSSLLWRFRDGTRGVVV